MKPNKTILFFLGILMISLVSPLTYNLTAGESQSFDIGEVFTYYSFVGNTTEVDVEITQEGTIVTTTPNKYSTNDVFEIIFFNKEKEVIYQNSGGGGSSSSKETKTIFRDVEVPTYLDRETIVEVNNTIEVEKEIPQSKGIVFLLILVSVILICIVIKVIHSKITERRFKKYERNEQEEKIE